MKARGYSRPALRLACVSALAATALLAIPQSATAGEAYAATPPRYMSLGADLANGREGPSRDHRILWVYQRRGLPVKVVQEWQNWRKVEDPFGDQTWLLARNLQRQRTIYVVGDDGRDAALRRSPAPESRVTAEIARGVTGELRDCTRGWCEVRFGKLTGWMPRRTLWGADGGAPQ